MSEFRNAIRNIVTDREIGTLEFCVNLRTGEPFMAEVEEISDLELLTDLGLDLREAITIHVSDRKMAAQIRDQQQIQVTLYGAAKKFRVIRRKDNPASPQVEFIAQVVTQLDT